MKSLFATTALLFAFAVTRVAASEPPVTISNGQGASATFSEDSGTWRWTSLTTPAAAEARTITEGNATITVGDQNDELAPRWTLTEQQADRLVFEQDAPASGLRFRRVVTFGPAANVVRIATWASSPDGTRILKRAGLLELDVAGESFRETGAAPASFPAFGQTLFAGIEHVSGICQAQESTVHLWQTPCLSVGPEWQFVAAAVVGWVIPSDCSLLIGEGRIRDAFLQYLDTIRIKPADLELHTNTWWTLPLPFSEKDVLKDIESLRQGFTERTGMFFDSFALDLGWSDNRTIWEVDAKRFPDEFRTINDRLNSLGSKLGIWVSPGSAYPPGLDNRWLESSGYEMTPFGDEKVACFALGGRYQREFKENLLRLVRDYGIRHVKLDFMAHTCDVAAHGHPTGLASFHAIDAGLADVLDSLRAANPNIVLEPLCCGYPPSPWWTTKTPYVLGPYGDDVPYGRVPAPDWMESLITARDIAYRADRERWIMPTQALETIDIVVQSPGNFENLAVMAFGRGRWFISTYLKPEMMPAKNWDFLAALVRWARANKQYLGNALTIGGKPENREAYGYMFHNADKDLYCLRNPWFKARWIQLPACGSVRDPRELRMIFPRRETVAHLEPGGDGPWLLLAPYETVMLETAVPDGPMRPVVEHPQPEASIGGAEPIVEFSIPADSDRAGAIHYSWNGEITPPDGVNGTELCVLVEGVSRVENATCTVSVDGRPMRVRESGSAGQFGAAASPSPENWTWFIVPLAAGTRTIDIALDVPLESASIGVYLRGSTPAVNDPAPENAVVFPVSQTESRAWSQTVVPLTEYSEDSLTMSR